MATHSSILAWRIPWIEEPGGLQSIESQRHGWSDLAHMPQGEGGWGHLLGEPLGDQGALTVGLGEANGTGDRWLSGESCSL